MNTNKFYLLIIIIILIIIISLFIQCNKKVLKNLEEKATKDIIETYYHLGSSAPTEPGQMGYKIINISKGRYGGRSSQEVLNNIGSHTVGNYISTNEKDSYESSYGSNLFNSTISGNKIYAIDCKINSSISTCQDLSSSIGIGSHSIIRKLGNEVDLTNGIYGGTPCPINFYKHNDGNTYEVLKDDSFRECTPSDERDNLLNINVHKDNTITISEPTYHGFFYSEEVFNILDITVIHNIINYEILFKLLNNYKKDNQDNVKDKMISKYDNYLKHSKNGKYYNISIEEGYKFVFTNCGQTGRLGPSQLQCDATYGSGVVKTEEGIQNFIVPLSGKYKITAIGANGGNSSTDWGRGYLYEGEFNLNYNDNLKILIGQKGEDNKAGGGGGATYVLKKLEDEETELIISGGGGGIYKGREYTTYSVPDYNITFNPINYTNAKTYRNHNKVTLVINNYGDEKTYFEYGLTDKRYGETPKIYKSYQIYGTSVVCETNLAKKMGNGGKVHCPNSPEGGFGGGGGGGGDNKTLLSPDSVGGGGGGYFGGASGYSESTRGDLMFYAELLKSDPSYSHLIENIKIWINDAQDKEKNVPLNYWNGIGGSSYINEGEAIRDTIIERVITDNDMDDYETNGHGKVIIEYLGES